LTQEIPSERGNRRTVEKLPKVYLDEKQTKGREERIMELGEREPGRRELLQENE
jgi:hypothetical protein